MPLHSGTAGRDAQETERIHTLLASVPDPHTTERYLHRLQQQAPDGFTRILESSASLRCALHLFSYSNFLSEACLKDPEALWEASRPGSLEHAFTVDDYTARLHAAIPAGVPSSLELASFRRRELLRIALRDVLGLAVLSEITGELSNVADAILDVAYRRIREEFAKVYGEPLLADGRPCGFSVISLGKLGGQELNYSSDIDLMFVYGGPGETNGATPVTNKEFYKKVANRYTELLSAYTGESQCYRVDLRLRPDGTLGEICISVEGAIAYYGQRARDWEKQMLIKARVSAGDLQPGAELLDFVEPLIYQTSLDFKSVEAMSETRQRISEKLAAKRGSPSGLDIKLSPGGIRDIEFLTQCLQRLHGGREQWVRHGGTMISLLRLRDKGLLSGAEYARLAAAYQFLRYLEHRLQLEEDRQTHTLPSDPKRFEILAAKMPGDATGNRFDGETLRARLNDHLSAVREIYERVVHAQRPIYYTINPPVAALEEASDSIAPPSNLTRFLDQRAPGLAQVVASSDLYRGRERFEHFLEKAFANPDLLARLESSPELAAKAIDIFEHSPYFADDLLRYPELLEEIGEPFQLESLIGDASALRRFYRRQMLRIQGESILDSASIFKTLKQTSVLADSVIGAAYRLAVAEAPPPSFGYVPGNQMMVIALGRLGMSEFDLGSDADLIFVIPDADAAELRYWTVVAERMIQTLSSYTGEGLMFAIDTRLRPNGREGGLVLTEAAYKEYFEGHAEAWEGISYMKARAVAGHAERATAFLNELQVIDWRRYGQSMRSRRELAEMRARLEREQGPRNPLKAGSGGYYDIDFSLMYLRLKGAGIFYKVLNTPERIDVIEKMGHLERADAVFLREAATFYRAIDHGQRILSGHAVGSLPAAQAQLDALTNLVKRWTPETLRDRRIDVALHEIRQRTRQFFERTFGRA
ncbi:MAG TPA: glutamine-synthetase adenylyltransferase [Bryobacteraceae bacterium]|jgi:glutamate-ammonia-ligase adenylyltransferase|nr:glutamine-synthetase adenylyltransferase [Bryobacteraceae bacterium]